MVDAGAGFCKAERNGNQIAPEGSNSGSKVAELSRAEIEEADIDPETELVIEELADGAKVRELDENERYIKADLDSDKAEKFFSESEIEELQDRERELKGESEPEDIDEVWDGIREGVREHNKEVAKNKKELEKKRLKEAYRDPAMDKKMKNMTGEQMQRVMNSDDSSSTVDEEELQAALNQVDKKYAPILDESEPDIKDPANEIEELDEGLEAWKEIGGVWEEMAQDVEDSSEVPAEITTLENGKRLVRTTDDEFCEELRQVEENPDNFPDKGAEIVEDNGNMVAAEVYKER